MTIQIKRWISRFEGLGRQLRSSLPHGAIIGAWLFSGAAIANPDTPAVVAGNASFNNLGNTLQVTNSPGTIINWQGFSISPSEITRFVQQSDMSAVLNRVTGGLTSSLQGQLLSNGKVFLVNPNGIVIGGGALIDTSGFVGSTLDISDQDFLAGNYQFSGNGGAIVNNGVITAGPGGEVILIAPTVENTGTINARDGEIILAAGQQVTLTSLESENISFIVSAPGNRAVNLGSLVAQNGAIGVFADQVMQSGSISANRVTQDGAGRIILHGSSSTDVAGDVSATGEGLPGGEIQILGKQISLKSASIDASGTNGGRILIGGEFQGQGKLPRANRTDLDENTVVHADAMEHGNGGEIIIWSEQSTRSLGRLTARGGTESGDGGLVETSSRGSLDFAQPADVSASNGNPGTWLLDPEDIVIDSGKADSISSALNGGSNVTVKTADSGSGEGNITVAAPIRKTEGDDASLGLIAHSAINVNAPITSTSATLNVSLRAGRDISVNAAISTNGGQYSASINPALAPAAPEEVIEQQPLEQGSAEMAGDTEQPAEETAASTGQQVSEEPITTSVQQQNSAESIVAQASNNTVEAAAIADEPATSQGISLLASIDTSGGDVVVNAGTDGLLTVSSSVDAGNSESGSVGGNIQLLGNQIGLFDDAVVNASGAAGGGTVLIGGDQLGANPQIANADAVYISESASVHADALEQGDGGRVIVFAEEAANIYGEITATGGTDGGNGGFVETSARQSLRVTSAPDVSAQNGQAGEWLIDPATITIDETATALPLSPNPFAASTDTVLGVDLIYNSLAQGSNVTIIANGPGAGDTEGNINWIADLDLDGLSTFTSFTDMGSITLEASNDIDFSASIFDSVPSTPGDVLGSLILTAGGDVTFEAGDSDVLINADDITITANNLSLLAESATGSSVTISPDGELFDPGNLVLAIGDTILLRSGGNENEVLLGDSNTSFNVTADIDATNLQLEQNGASDSVTLAFTDFFGDPGSIDLTGTLTLAGGQIIGDGDINTNNFNWSGGDLSTYRQDQGYTLNTSGIVNIDSVEDIALSLDWLIGAGGEVNWSDGDIRTNRDITNNGVFNALGDNSITTGPTASIGFPAQPFPADTDIGTVDFINNGQFIKSGSAGGSTIFGDDVLQQLLFDGEVFRLGFSPPIQFINNGTLSAEAGDILFYQAMAPVPGAQPFGGLIQDNASALTELTGGSLSSQVATYSTSFAVPPPVTPLTTGTVSFLQGELTGGITATTATGGSINADVVLEDVTVSPGQSPGTLTINGDLSANNTTEFDIELGGINPGDYDVINVNGVATLAGSTINAALINGFNPPAGANTNTFNVINAEVLNLSAGPLAVNQPAGLAGDVVAGDGNSAVSYFLNYIAERGFTALAEPLPGQPAVPGSPGSSGPVPVPRSGFDPVPGIPAETTPPAIPDPFDSSDLVVTLLQQDRSFEFDDFNDSPEFLQCY